MAWDKRMRALVSRAGTACRSTLKSAFEAFFSNITPSESVSRMVRRFFSLSSSRAIISAFLIASCSLSKCSSSIFCRSSSFSFSRNLRLFMTFKLLLMAHLLHCLWILHAKCSFSFSMFTLYSPPNSYDSCPSGKPSISLAPFRMGSIKSSTIWSEECTKVIKRLNSRAGIMCFSLGSIPASAFLSCCPVLWFLSSSASFSLRSSSSS
mmetsp:Transcript_51458/g.128118  ORF Transcript_51458/g.128118 Transcript_51458/m.128118 type:complete len:208 (-) Transcript_51458:644-1267(-)